MKAGAPLYGPLPAGAELQKLERRLWAKIDKGAPEECWEWTARRNADGYGQFYLEGKLALAHRMAWWLIHSSIPESICVLHTCDNPPCCNPNHLFLGTKADNAEDRDGKGRRRAPKGELNTAAKLTEEQVLAIRRESASGETSQKELAHEYGVTPPAISKIVLRKTWRHI